MKTDSLIPDIKDDLKIIARRIFKSEDNFADQKWLDLKAAIHELAANCLEAEKEEKARDREERKVQRAWAKQRKREQAAGGAA